ncbi:LemA family protein [Paracrocinitomix mangrovi]|uniref:LemA family protein n=1 Tax=Paracrocinitomix mangrovi TaxID=2862509 RepID=UPI001C8CF468|nr:LemA family protein [Paracrocinitomix mangrovi]UKN02918.1 LemA family protein [Paracrocinitomix mangrovi]
MDYNEEKFKEHIKAVVEASQSSDDTLEERPLSLKELKELAISMGMTEEEWNNLQMKAHEHLKAADDHLKARNFSEAIAEAEKATAINPYIKNGNAVLAKSYLMRWMETHSDEHRDKAEFHARQELKVDPRDQIAVMVLSTIDKKKRVLAGDASSKKRLFIILGVAIVLIVIGLFFFSLASSKEAASTQEEHNSAEYDRIKNELIEAEEDVASKWDMVQTAIDRRNSLIPDLISAINSSTEESIALKETISSLQEKIKNSEGEERFALENDLATSINEAKKLAKETGENKSVMSLMAQMEGSENRIAYQKKNYNEAVKHYNILVKKNTDKFPEYETKPYFSSK